MSQEGSRNGLLIDYHYCTGCRSCEIACQQEHGYPAGQFGIKITEHVLEKKNGLTIDYLPFPTDLCNLCAHRTRDGVQPSCVKHCQARCMYYGTVAELAHRMEEQPKTVLFVPEKSHV